MSKITIHRGLTELKSIDDRITKALKAFKPIAMTQKDKQIDGRFTADEFAKNAKADYQSVTDLIERKFRIAAAISLANSVTFITVCGRSMSIAQAILYKKAIEHKRVLLSGFENSLAGCVKNVDENNKVVDQNAINLAVQVTAESKDKKDTIDLIQGIYKDIVSFTVLDPLNSRKIIMSLDTEINDFANDIDAKLSAANAITEIDVD